MSSFIQLLSQLLNSLKSVSPPPPTTPPWNPMGSYSVQGPAAPQIPLHQDPQTGTWLDAYGRPPARQIPPGPIAGTMHRLPTLYDQLGANRPLGPGEYVSRTGGGVASEETVGPWKTANNLYMVAPGLWLINGVPTSVTEDQARELVRQSNLNFPTFPSREAGNAYINQRENIWEKNPQEGNTWIQPPVWSQK